MAARGTHPQAWGFPAPDVRAADRLFLKYIGMVRFLPQVPSTTSQDALAPPPAAFVPIPSQ